MTTNMPTIKQAKELRAKWGLQHCHLVWIGPTGFVIAHDNWERKLAHIVSLESCPLHIWLSERSCQPASEGWHVAMFNIRSGEWEFDPLDYIDAAE